jgi:hypothetical protein
VIDVTRHDDVHLDHPLTDAELREVAERAHRAVLGASHGEAARLWTLERAARELLAYRGRRAPAGEDR